MPILHHSLLDPIPYSNQTPRRLAPKTSSTVCFYFIRDTARLMGLTVIKEVVTDPIFKCNEKAIVFQSLDNSHIALVGADFTMVAPAQCPLILSLLHSPRCSSMLRTMIFPPSRRHTRQTYLTLPTKKRVSAQASLLLPRLHGISSLP